MEKLTEQQQIQSAPCELAVVQFACKRSSRAMAKNVTTIMTAARRSARRVTTVAEELASGDDVASAASASRATATGKVHSTTLTAILSAQPSALAPLPPKNKFVGVHVSASGGPERAIANSVALGPLARSMALFIRPRLSWKPQPPLSESSVTRFHASLAKTQQQIRLEHVAVHGSYLINFGSHDANLREKSVALMVEEVSKCAQLGIQLYVFHPGSCTGDELVQQRKLAKTQSQASQKSKKKAKPSLESPSSFSPDWNEAQVRRQSIAFIADCMVQVLNRTENVTLVVENMAGQGHVLGHNFQELREILDSVADLYNQQELFESQGCRRTIQERIGVCLDTCHAFASGYKLHTTRDCELTMRDFDNFMLPQWPNALKVVHLNDSKTACGSNVDRHASIGQGEIGIEAFRWLMNNPRFENLPLILETPRAKKPKKHKKTSVETETEVIEVNIQVDLGSKKRKKQETDFVGMEESVEATIPSATQEFELLYSLATQSYLLSRSD